MSTLFQRIGLLLACTAASVSATPLASTAGAEVISDAWYTTTILDKRVGFLHEQKSSSRVDGVEQIQTTMEIQFTIRRMGTEQQIRSRAVFVETADGEPIRFESDNQLSANTYRIRAERKGDFFIVTQEAMGKTTEAEIPFSTDILFPVALEREVRKLAWKPGTTVSLKTFSPDLARPTRVSFTCLSRQEITIAGRTRHTLLFESEQELVPGVVLKEWRDPESGELLQSILPLFGLEIVSRRSSRAEALLGPESVELLVTTLISAREPIPHPRRLSRAVFRLRYKDNKRDAGDLPLPEDERQRVLGRSPEAVLLEVKSERWSKAKQVAIPGRSYRAASSVLQSDDPVVRAMADEVAPKGESLEGTARKIARWVERAVNKKSLAIGLATASEVARDRTGDCTEHAVLAAALARSRGIPSKIAVGLVYVDGAFGYHMWTEVFDGGWHAIDPTFGQDANDATHIKLAESSLENGFVDAAIIGLVQLITNLEIEVAEYDLDGATYQGGAAASSGSFEDGRYRNAMYGISLTAPVGWRLLPPTIAGDGKTLLLLEGPEGAIGEVRATSRPYDFSLLRWLSETVPEFKIAKETTFQVQGRLGHRFLLEADGRAALLAFLDRDTLFTIRVSPLTYQAELGLGNLLRSIRLEN